jgi:hypothetical protein
LKDKNADDPVLIDNARIEQVSSINPFSENKSERLNSRVLNFPQIDKLDPNSRYEMTDKQAYSVIQQKWQKIKLVEDDSAQGEPELYQSVVRDLLNQKEIAFLYLKFPGVLDYESINQSSKRILQHLDVIGEKGYLSILIPDLREADLRTTNIPGLVLNAPALTGIFDFPGLTYIFDVNSKVINFVNLIMSARKNVENIVIKNGLPDAIRIGEFMINGKNLGTDEQIKLI